MKRHFDNFLDAYVNYARNQYAPEQFTLWAGISIVAAVLERKVWLQEKNFKNYPNLFVILAAGPGIGKTSAIRPAVELVYGIQKQEMNPYFKTIEGVSSSAGLRNVMMNLDNMPDGINQFSSIFMIGKEGSESALKNHGDDFRSAACALYDCEERYQFTLKEKQITIPQPVMNMLVGTTFDFLGSVVDQNSVFGGLASRFTYILEKDTKMRGEFFQGVEVVDEKEEVIKAEKALASIGFGYSRETKEKLIEDLYQIHRMYGNYRIKKEVVLIVKEWFESFKKEYNNTESERIRAINIRKRALLKKLIMILAAARSNDLVITGAHALEAIELIESATKDNAYIMSQALMANIESQGGLNELILHTIKKNEGKISLANLKKVIFTNGNDVSKVEPTIGLLIGSGLVTLKDGTVYEGLDSK